MYKEHFAVQRPLFADGVARDADVYLGPRQQLAAANLKIALSTRDSIAVLSGAAGVGKTTIASYAVRAAATRLALGWLGAPPLTPHELLEQLLSEFDFSPYKSSRVERMQIWRQFLNEMSITDTRVVVVVENAQDYAPDVLRGLGSLTAADPNGCPGANVVLTSAVPARELLSGAGLEPIKQRLRLTVRIDPCNAKEMDAYLRHRCKIAGADYDKIFAPGTAVLLQRYSGGLLRVANNLCESALTVAATRKDPLLHPELLTRVAVGLFGMAPAGVGGGAESADPAPARAPRETPSPQAHPIVGARAAATVAMMAAEASLEAELDEAPDAPTETAPAGENPDAPTETAPAGENHGAPTAAEDDHQDAPTADGRDDPNALRASGPVHETMEVGAASEPENDDAGAASAREQTADDAARPAAVAVDVPTVSDAVGPSTTTHVSEPTKAPSAPPAADEATAAAAERASSSTIEFVGDEDPEQDPFAVDETLMADAGDTAEHGALDLPVLTDTVEAGDDDVAAAMQASSDAALGDASLATEFAALDDDVDREADAVAESEAVYAQGDAGTLERDVEAEAAEHKREALAALAHAKALEEISNSMAETLFGDAELEQLSATLALSTAAEDEDDLELEIEDDSSPSRRSQAL